MDGRTDGREDGGMEGGGKRSVDETVANLELKRNCKLMTKEEEFHFNVYDTKKKKCLSWKGPQKSHSSNSSVSTREDPEILA